MKYTVLFLLLFTALACEPTTQELIIGKWKYSRLEKNGKVFLSSDPEEARRIIDKLVDQNFEYTKDVAKFRENAMEEMDQRLDVYLEFKADSTVDILTGASGENGMETWKYSINEESKNILLESGSRKIQYVYKLEKDVLKLTETSLKIELKKMD